MHNDLASQASPPANLPVIAEANSPQQIYGATMVERSSRTPAQLLVGNGLPATIGVGAAMVVMGATLVPALAFGLVSGLAFTLLGRRSQR